MRLRVDLYTMSGTLVQELYEGNAVTGVQYVMDIDADALSTECTRCASAATPTSR